MIIFAILLVLGISPVTSTIPSAGNNTADGVYQALIVVGISPVTSTTPSAGNNTADRAYQANMKLLLEELPKNASSSPWLYAKGSVGAAPDTAYGLAVCRGYMSASSCGSCIATLLEMSYKDQIAQFKETNQSKKSSGILSTFDCTAGMSHSDILETVNHSKYYSFGIGTASTLDKEPLLQGWDPNDIDNVNIITGFLKVLLVKTGKMAAYSTGRRYATGRMDISTTFPALYSVAQCIPDLTPTDCWACLKNLSDDTIQSFNGQKGYDLFNVLCGLAYDVDQFYSGDPMLHIGGHRSRNLVIMVVVPVLAMLICIPIAYGLILRHRTGKVLCITTIDAKEDETRPLWGFDGMHSDFTVYELSEVLHATRNFSEENKLGQGGFGPVYKGQFDDGLEIAVKRLASHSGQGFTEFKNEIQLIAKLQHTNLVKLLGCCFQKKEKILIYEYLPNKSLDFFIFDESRRELLDWSNRLAIIDGIAQGLVYLHKHSRLRVIHRDLKASNILLDHEMTPKISDFGLAKIFNKNDSEGNTTRIAGTYGYMAPEYASQGIFSIKSDVFSFGVLTLEIVSGQRSSNFHQYGEFINILGHAWQLWKEGRWQHLVDTAPDAEYHTLEMMRCINIALLCVQENAVDRPTMEDVVAMLNSDTMTLPEPKPPAYFHLSVTQEETYVLIEPGSINDVTLSTLGGR